MVPTKTGTKDAVSVCGRNSRHHIWKPDFSFKVCFVDSIVVLSPNYVRYPLKFRQFIVGCQSTITTLFLRNMEKGNKIDMYVEVYRVTEVYIDD